MKQKIKNVCNALRDVTQHEINRLEFVRACKRLKRKHAAVNNIRFKILKACLREMDAIGIPVTPEEKELMSHAVSLYDQTLEEIKTEPDRFRQYLEL